MSPPASIGLLTTNETAAKLGVSRRRVLALVASGRLPAVRVGNQFLIQPADLAKVRDRKPGRPKNADAPTAARRATLRKVGMPTTSRRKGKG
jgi:excisionase family DNA binding protein